MANPRTRPYALRPSGVSDTLDSDTGRKGAMAALTNLIPDPSTPGVYQCRPAAESQTTFSSFTTPGFISVYKVVGSYAYGLIASGRNTGLDEPFCWDIVNKAFKTVSGITTAKCPTSPATTGAWNPPTMDLMGAKLVVTHPGFDGSTYFYGVFDISTPDAPTWDAGNTATNGLPSLPRAVVGYSNRLYFACANNLYYTDTLALTMTLSTQFLTFGDNTAITALAQLPLFTDQQGGIVQSFMAFKEVGIVQITGDISLSTLTMSVLSSTEGTLAPRSVSATPMGVAFVAADGVRLITQQGAVSPPDNDIAASLISPITPSRISGCYNNGVYRLCFQNSTVSGQPYQDFWLDTTKKGWSGPHSFRHDMLSPYEGSFLLFNGAVSHTLFMSDVVQSGSSSFTENGTALSFTYETPPMPNGDGMYENSAVISTIDMVPGGTGTTYNFEATDTIDGILNQCSLTVGASLPQWGTATWGSFNWSAAASNLRAYNIPWTIPLVFNRLSVTISGSSVSSFRIGTLKIGYTPLAYVRTS